jgi:hypothetical protein
MVMPQTQKSGRSCAKTASAPSLPQTRLQLSAFHDGRLHGRVKKRSVVRSSLYPWLEYKAMSTCLSSLSRRTLDWKKRDTDAGVLLWQLAVKAKL